MRVRVVDERRPWEPDLPRLRGVSDGHTAHLEPATRAALDVVAVALEQPEASDDILRVIEDAVRAHRGAVEAADDATMVALKVG